MPATIDSASSEVATESGDDACGILPTRQKNALRHLLDRQVITPKDVAGLDYKTLERAAGVGEQGIRIIQAWLRHHGFELSGQPRASANPRVEQRRRKIERAIAYLRQQGYDVRAAD